MRSDLLQQLQPFAGDFCLADAEPGGVAAGMREAGDKSAADRIVDQSENDRDGSGLREQGCQPRPADADDHIRFKSDQLLGAGPNAFAPTARETMLDCNITAVGPTQIPQPLDQGACQKNAEQIFRSP